MSHKHSVYDTDPHFSIDPVTRAIKNESGKVFITQHDHNSERFTFDIPKEVDGHNMSLCNRVRIHYINVDSSTKEFTKDIYDVSDLGVSPSDGNVVIFSWLLSGNATMYQGSLNFGIRFECVESNGTVTYSWGTAVHSGIFIGADIYNSEYVSQEYSDILAKWEAEIFGAGDSVMADISAAGDLQKDAIAAKAEAVLATIPEDYTVTNLMADAALRTKASAIVVEVEGETIILNDSSDDHIRGLKVYGKTTQDGAPTPDAPVELVSIDKPKILLCGKNLVFGDATRAATMNNGITINVTEGSSEFILNGEQNATSNASAFLVRSMMLYPGTYTVSVYGLVGSDYINVKQLSGEQHYLFTAATRDHPKTFTVDERIEIGVEIVVRANSYYSNTMVKIQLEAGDSVTDYESYIEPYTMTSNLVLRGIPVTSGGNYTDENGQQWIADYVDFERGVYVQQIVVLTVPDEVVAVRFETYDGDGYYGWYYTDNTIRRGHNSYGNDIVSDRFVSAHTSTPKAVNLIRAWCSVGNIYYTISSDSQEDANAAIRGALVYYALATPIETPLTEEELYAFSRLHSNYPTTTVLNDSGAHMVVRYNADAKTYIDNKIAELIASITGNS